MNRRSVSTLNSTEGNLIVLWSGLEKEIPPPPGERSLYAETQEEYWYDWEYGALTRKKAPELLPPGDGPRGKRVVFLSPGGLSYLTEFNRHLRKVAMKADIRLEIHSADWDPRKQAEQLELTLASKPDLVLINPENISRSSEVISRIHRSGIPVIACNFLPQTEAFDDLISWTGPDDWGQSRAVAREFARRMNYTGKYCILRHIEGTSSYYARTWGVITELKKIAPLMECLDMAAPGLQTGPAEETVALWLKEHPGMIQGIVCADDDLPMRGVRNALERAGLAGRIICAAFGSSRYGLELVKEGILHVLAFQSPAVDATVAMQTVVDWFDGLRVEPVRYLPIYIVTSENVDGLLRANETITSVNFERLQKAIEEFDFQGVYDFFTTCYLNFVEMKLVSQESFNGFGLESIGFFLSLIKEYKLPPEELFVNYENMYKRVFSQKTIGAAIQWMINLSLSIIDKLSQKLKQKTVVQEVLDYVNRNYCSPISLKTLSEEFAINAIYLGQVFKNATGMKFNDYLNELRIKEAKRRLLTSALSASSIGKAVGYSDPNYFYKVFHKVTGKTVGEFERNP